MNPNLDLSNLRVNAFPTNSNELKHRNTDGILSSSNREQFMEELKDEGVIDINNREKKTKRRNTNRHDRP